MRTQHAPFTLEGTLEIIDLSHASEEDAMRAVLQELRARREGRPRRGNGSPFTVEFGHAPGHPGASARAPRAQEPPAPRHAPAGAGDGDGTAPLCFASFGELLRYAAAARMRREGETADAPEEPEPPCAHAGPADHAEHILHLEEHGAMEQFLAERTVIFEDDGAGRMAAAAVVGFGLGAAAMYLARRFRYAPPPSVRHDRPRHPRRESDVPWHSPLDTFDFGFSGDPGDEQDDEEASPDE
jgi:hypothetical protein